MKKKLQFAFILFHILLIPFFLFSEMEKITDANYEEYYKAYLSLLLPEALTKKDFTAVEQLYQRLNSLRKTSYEPIFRAKLLTALEAKTLDLEGFSRKEVLFLLDYKDEMDQEKTQASLNYGLKYKYNQMTVAYAKSISQAYQPNSAEYLLCLFYMNEFNDFFSRLWKGKPEDSKLHKVFWDFRREHEGFANNLSVMAFTGIWQPLGDNLLLGTQPVLGLTLGKGFLFMEGSITLLVCGLIPTDHYSVLKNKEEITRTMFFRLYLGGEISFLVFVFGQHEIRLLTGIGGDGNFDFQSFNINAGLGYRYYFNEQKDWFIFSELRYDLINYENEGGTDLSGPALSLRAGFGLTINDPILRKINAGP
jgi:hypothetical protein